MTANTCTTIPGLPDLLDASFRGVPFFVERDAEDIGRRIVTDEFPNRDDPYNEDLGQRYTEFKVNAYLYGATVSADYAALRAALLQEGAGPLILPATPSVNVVFLSATRTRSLEKVDWLEVEMTFRVDPKQDAPQTVAVSASNIVGAQYALAASQTGAFITQFNPDTPAANQVTAAQRIQDFAATVVSALQQGVVASRSLIGSANGLLGALLDPATAILASVSQLSYSAQLALSDAQFEMSLLTGNASDIAQAAQSLFTYAQQLANGNPDGTPRADVIPAVATVLLGMASAMNVQDAYTTYQKLATFTSIPPPAAVRCQSDLDDIVNEHAFCGAVRKIAIGCLANTLATYPFATRAQAVQARADFVELCDNELELIQQQVEYTTWTWPETTTGSTRTITYGGATPTVGTITVDFNDPQSADALTTCRDIAVQMISNAAANLDQVITVDATAALPAIWWAYRLNEAPEGAADLITQNGAADGNFMPTSFQAQIDD